MKNEPLDATKRELERVGIDYVVRHDSKHVKVTWRIPAGKTRTAVVAWSGSDRKNVVAARAIVRRYLRDDGILSR